GGRVVVPPGTWLVGAVRLASDVELHVERGAILKFSGDPALYPPVVTRFEGIECVNRSPMIYAYGASNVAVTGDGTLDGSATVAWNRGDDRPGLLEPLGAGGAPRVRLGAAVGARRAAGTTKHGRPAPHVVRADGSMLARAVQGGDVAGRDVLASAPRALHRRHHRRRPHGGRRSQHRRRQPGVVSSRRHQGLHARGRR